MRSIGGGGGGGVKAISVITVCMWGERVAGSLGGLLREARRGH